MVNTSGLTRGDGRDRPVGDAPDADVREGAWDPVGYTRYRQGKSHRGSVAQEASSPEQESSTWVGPLSRRLIVTPTDDVRCHAHLSLETVRVPRHPRVPGVLGSRPEGVLARAFR